MPTYIIITWAVTGYCLDNSVYDQGKHNRRPSGFSCWTPFSEWLVHSVLTVPENWMLPIMHQCSCKHIMEMSGPNNQGRPAQRPEWRCFSILLSGQQSLHHSSVLQNSHGDHKSFSHLPEDMQHVPKEVWWFALDDCTQIFDEPLHPLQWDECLFLIRAKRLLPARNLAKSPHYQGPALLLGGWWDPRVMTNWSGLEWLNCNWQMLNAQT